MNRAKHFLAALMPLLSATTVLAEEGHGGGANNPFAGDIGNAIWTMVIFVIVLIVLGKFAWGPILSALQKREAFIRESLEKAKNDRDEAQRVLKEYADRINSARTEATAIVEEGRKNGDLLKHKIEETAKAEAQGMVERAKREIGIARDTAVKDVYTLSAKLATEMAGRIIKKELNGKEHERLISESIDEIVKAVPT
jgi:F-type H+-transporting ATPase subunit b